MKLTTYFCRQNSENHRKYVGADFQFSKELSMKVFKAIFMSQFMLQLEPVTSRLLENLSLHF